MRSSDWQPMETAPLNPYGKPWGPSVLIWDRATRTAITAYFEPWHGWKDRDCGPAWIVDDGTGDSAIAPEDAAAWMPIEPPEGEKGSNAMMRDREENGRFPGCFWEQWTDAMCWAFAYGFDAEDAAQRDEPNPRLANPGNIDKEQWQQERIACVRVGLETLALHLTQPRALPGEGGE